MFERFSNRARRAVVLAQEEARLLDHGHIGTEHLLLGLLAEHEGAAGRALDGFGVELEPVRERVRDAVGQAGPAPSGHVPFTDRAKKALELSLREALESGRVEVGTAHLLLGLIREGSGVATRVLAGLGVDLPGLRQAVLSMQPTPPARAPDHEYLRLLGQVDDVSERLRRHPDPVMVDLAGELRGASDRFNRVGVHRLVELITEWRGDLFLDAAFRDPIAGPFLDAHGIRKPD